MKRFLAALTFTTAVMSFVPVPLVAQTNRPQPPAPPAARIADPELSAEAIRERFNEVMRRYPRNVGRVLRMEPSLLQDANYLANYPPIQQFVAQYPEVARNPEYYLAEYSLNYDPYSRGPEQQALNMMRSWVEGFMVFVLVASIAAALLWLLKALIDHRRWLRVSKIQTEVHSKLLDRFSSSEELLAYMRTPAGARFLESAPIALDAGPGSRSVSAPLNRILWSVQAGIVVLVVGLAPFVARNWTTYEEVRTMLAILGVIGSFIGIGFILSALASYVLSRRLGLLDGTGSTPAPSVAADRRPIDSAGL